VGVEHVLDVLLLAQRQGLLTPLEPGLYVQPDGLLAEAATGALEEAAGLRFAGFVGCGAGEREGCL
jgi:hypothetical protein